MKKLLTLTFALLVSLSIFGGLKVNPKIVDEKITDWVIDQLKEMGYTVLPEVIVQDTLTRKHPMRQIENDDLYFNPKTDIQRQPRRRMMSIEQTIDTLVKENPNITVNVYDLDPFYHSNMIGRYYHGGFNYWRYSDPYYYNSFMYSDFGWGWNPYYSYNYPFYNNFYFGYITFGNYWRPFPDWNFGLRYYGYNHNNWAYNNYYGNNVGNFQSKPDYVRRERPSTISSQRRADTKPTYNQSVPNRNRREYVPSYSNPRLNVRPNFNNSRVNNEMQNRGNVNQIGTDRRSTNNSPIMRPNDPRTQTRTYSAPTTNRSYSQPSNGYNNTNRSSNYSQPSNNYSSGSRNSVSSGSNGSFNSGGGSSRSSGGSISSPSSRRR